VPGVDELDTREIRHQGRRDGDIASSEQQVRRDPQLGLG